jgi:hypothetical protein
MNKDEIGGSCSAYGKGDTCIENSGGNTGLEETTRKT